MKLEEVHRATGAPWRDVPGGRSPAWHSGATKELAACLDAAGLVDRSHGGRLRVAGSARLGYLQRITAQSFDGLAPPHGVLAAILERRGKIIDVISAHAFPEHLLVLTSAALKDATREWIRRFIFRDDVQVDDESTATGQLLLVGPRALQVAAAWTGERAGDLAAQQWLEHPRRPGSVLIRHGAAAWQALHIVAPAAEMVSLWHELLEAGDQHGLKAVGEDAYQALRVLCGIPEGGAEVDERANPMELGLTDSFCLDKGCYTGQEVLAKMQTHDSVKRRLVGLELSADAPPAAGRGLFSGEEVVGRITSVAPLPGRPRCVGLALVAREHAAPGTVLGSENGTGAEVMPLPFPV